MRIFEVVKRVRSADPVLFGLLFASLAFNVYLGAARGPSIAIATPRPPSIAPGTQAPLVQGTTIDGRQVRISFNQGRAVLLYVFSPTCHWCERNKANLRAVASARKDLEIIGLNVGPKMNADQARQEPYSQIVQPSPETAKAYRLGPTPTTILISASGTVVNSWSGAYSGPTATDVSKVLSVTLPGLTSQ